MSGKGEREGEISRDVYRFNEAKAVERLRTEGIENVKFAFDITEERDGKGDVISAEISWVQLEKPEGQEFEDLAAIEGKIYLPKENANKELILFTPGFPGGNAGRFEQRYAKSFIDAGYTFFTVRHNGTSLTNGETSLEILNSAKRMKIAEQAGEHHIGGTKPEGYSPVDIVNEPIAPLMALQNKFKRIHLMGHSMGVAASYNTLRRMENHPEVLKKIGNVVGIAGYVGGDVENPDRIWDGLKMPMPELTKYEYQYVRKVDANMIPEERFEEEMGKVARFNDELVVPDHIGNILIYTPNDPLVSGPDKSGEMALETYGPPSLRKLIIRDESNLADKKQHSMLWISPQGLLRAVKAKVSGKGPHHAKLPNAEKGLIKQG